MFSFGISEGKMGQRSIPRRRDKHGRAAPCVQGAIVRLNWCQSQPPESNDERWHP